MKWRPIKSAPKDQWVLLAYPDFTNTRTMVWQGIWSADAWRVTDYDHGLRRISHPATHWMPMPKPPGRRAKR